MAQSLLADRRRLPLLLCRGSIAVNAAVIANQGDTLPPTSGGVVSLRTDNLSFGIGGTLQANFGSIELAPATPGLAMTVGGSVAASGPGLDVADLPVNGTPNLVLGATTNPTTGVATTTAGSITLAGSLDQGGLGFANLTLDSTGPVTRTAPLVAVGTLSGTTGLLTFTDPGNEISTLGPFSATGDFQLADLFDLTVEGDVAANNILLEVGAPNANNFLFLGNGATPTALTVPQGGRISLVADNFFCNHATRDDHRAGWHGGNRSADAGARYQFRRTGPADRSRHQRRRPRGAPTRHRGVADRQGITACRSSTPPTSHSMSR